MDTKNKLKVAQLLEDFQDNFNSKPETLNLDFTEQFSKSPPNLWKVPFKIKFYDDNILNRLVLKQNSNPKSHYPGTSQNIPLDNHHPNLQLLLKSESHIDSSYNEKISTESRHNKNETGKDVDRTLAKQVIQ